MNEILTGVTTEDNQSKTQDYRKALKKGQRVNGTLVCCAKCGATFFVSEEHAKWFADRDLDIPRTCVRCRRLSRQNREREKIYGKY